jgi:hypothetical protein
MTLQEFADQHKLKSRRSADDDNELIVMGRTGQIYQYSQNELGVLFMPPRTDLDPHGRWCPKKWNRLRKLGENTGMTLRQLADSEGAFSFDPHNSEQSKLAIQIAKVRPKRTLSPEHRKKLILAGKQLSACSQEVRPVV